MFRISHPKIGWDGIKFHPVDKDDNLKFLELWDADDQDWISVCVYLNKLFTDIPIDIKHPYQGRHLYLRFSLEEAKELHQVLGSHIQNYEKHYAKNP